MSTTAPIIDAHVHPHIWGFGRNVREIDRLVAYGRSLGIERMVALGDVTRYGASPTERQVAEVNDESAATQCRHPDYFLSFCFLNPTLGARSAVRELERCVENYRFVGIKLEACNNARDRCMRPVMEAAARLGLPVLQHSWSASRLPRKLRGRNSDPADTALLARRHPDVTIIMAHLSGCELRGILEIRDLGNVLIDTSGGPPVAELVELAVEHLGADRVLYGSDLPGRSPAVAVARVLGARLSPREKRQILYGNAARILKLPTLLPANR